jgi:hypothetical protein
MTPRVTMSSRRSPLHLARIGHEPASQYPVRAARRVSAEEFGGVGGVE